MTKIGKEIWAVIAILGFLLSWLIDRVAGPVSMNIGNPIAFLYSTDLLNKYPFTSTAILIRSVAIFISAMVIVSLIEKRFFTKAIALFFVGLLAEFYAIQQLATGFHITTIQWTLSIAYGSLLLALGIVWMILKAIWSLFSGGTAQKSSSEVTSEEKSVLTPEENK
jgi:hypothetical protein